MKINEYLAERDFETNHPQATNYLGATLGFYGVLLTLQDSPFKMASGVAIVVTGFLVTLWEFGE